jgi:hypothetical protein
MAHATIADVFNSFSRAASQGMEMITREKKYVRDKGLFDASMDLNERGNRITQARKMVYDDSGINYRKVTGYPETLQEYVDKTMGEWKAAWENKYSGRYYSDSLHEIEARGNLAIQQTVLSAETEYAVQKIDAEYEDEINRIFNSPMSPREKREAARKWTDYTRGAAGWNLRKYNEETDKYLALALQEELLFTPGKDAGGNNITTEAIETRYGGIAKEELRKGNPDADTEEERKDGNYARLPGAGDAIKIAREAAIQGQMAFNFRELQELDAEYDLAVRNYRTAVQKGDAAGVNAAYTKMMTLYNTGKPMKNAALDPKGKASEYNNDNRPQIMTMFPDPPGYEDGRPEKKRMTEAELLDYLVQQFINGFQDAEFSVDATGRLIGFTTPDGVYYTGLSLSAIYQELDRQAEAYGWVVAPGQLHHEFDKRLLGRMKDSAESSEAKRTFDQLVSFSESQWTDIQKSTGMDDDRIRETIMGQVLDAYARYSSSADPSPQKNAVLEQALKGIRDQYIGSELHFLYDDRKTSESTYTRNALGTLGNLGKALAAYHNNPDINLPGRSGGRNIPAHLDANFRAYTNRAEALAREELGAVSASVEGGDVIARDSEGNKYRVGGTSGGDIFLYRPDGNGGWAPIAKRVFPGEKATRWIKTDSNGEMLRVPNHDRYSRHLPSYDIFEGLK